MNEKNMPSNNKYFVYTGNAYPHKNLERLFKAMILLNKRSLSLRGENRKEKILLKISSSRNVFTDRLEKLIKDNNAEEYIKLLGFVQDSEIKDLYKNSVAFVFPTLSEGFGLPPMEAIEAGTLVVQSDISVLKEVYEDSTIYFNPMEVSSISKSLEKAINMKDSDRKTKILYSQNFIKKYSWAKMAKETLKVYESSIK